MKNLDHTSKSDNIKNDMSKSTDGSKRNDMNGNTDDSVKSDEMIKNNENQGESWETGQSDLPLIEEPKKAKKSHNSFGKGILVGIFSTIILLVVIVAVSTGMMMVNSSSGTGNEDTEGFHLSRIMQKSQYIQSIIERYFYFDEDFDAVEQGMYTGLVDGLGDPYAAYYTKEELDSVMEETEGVYCGIGAAVSQNLKTGVITILRVYEGSPAEEAGLMAGDILYKVDGIEATGQDLDLLVSQHVRGEEGTSVEIEVYRQSTDEYVTTNPVRRQVETPTVEHEMMEEKTGYVLVTSFENITDKQFRAAIEDLESQGMERLVIDLRNNPGGTLDSAIGMMSYILPDGLLFYDEDKNGNGTKFVSEDGAVWKISYTSEKDEASKQEFLEDVHELDMPIVLLVNENSASAAEAFTSALRDFDWASVVGTTTFGKGIVQTLIPLGDGSAVKLTTSHYFTKSGYDIHQQGLKPDVEIELSEELLKKGVFTKEEDNQIQKALEVVKTLE